MKIKSIFAFAVILCALMLTKNSSYAAENIGNVKFTFTDVYGETKEFDGGADKVKVIVYGGIGSCYNTMGTIETVSGVIDGIEAADCEIYAFNSVASNTNDKIKDFLSTSKISKRILVGQTESTSSNVYALRMKCNVYGMSRTMPNVYIVDKEGNFVAHVGGAEAISGVINAIENAGVVINKVAGGIDADLTEKVMEVKYGQTAARQELSMINDFRTGSDAWVWNADDTTKTTYSNLGKLTYDYDLEKVAMLRAAEIAYYYSHTRPNGYSCFSAYEGIYTASAYGENIAYGYPTTESVFEAWREDNENYDGQGHRRNMLNSKFTTFAVGHVTYKGTEYWVQLFGNRVQNATETPAKETTENVTIKVSPLIKQNEYSSISTGGGSQDELEHNWVVTSSEVTSSNDYYCSTTSTQICSGCGASSITMRTSPHDVITTIVKEATCSETGSKKEICKYCDHESTVTIAKISHTYDDGVVTKQATCTETGTKKYTCSACSATKESTISKLSAFGRHSYDSGAVTKETSYTKTGEKTHTCKVCEATKTEEIEKLTLGNPTITDLTVNKSDIKILWTAVEGATGYYVVCSTNGGKYKKIATVTGGSLAYTDTTAKSNGVKYQYKVMAYVTEEDTTVKSAYSGAKLTYFLSQPKISSLKNSSSKAIKATWGKNSKASGFEIQYSTSSTMKSAKKISVTKGTTASYVIKSLKKNKTYYVRVRSYKKVGDVKYYSAWSNISKLKIKK